MDSDFTNILNALMRQTEPDLSTRLDDQDEALKELTCTEPSLGKWFEEESVPYVLSALQLSDRDFASMFPALKNVSTVTRQQMLNAFENHVENCPRCFRKRSYDLEFEARLESTLFENREYLRSKLNCDSEEEASEENHETDIKTRSAHQS